VAVTSSEDSNSSDIVFASSELGFPSDERNLSSGESVMIAMMMAPYLQSSTKVADVRRSIRIKHRIRIQYKL
jgi:hemolysin-activating ACP:hemolysin acyltransferase